MNKIDELKERIRQRKHFLNVAKRELNKETVESLKEQIRELESELEYEQLCK